MYCVASANKLIQDGAHPVTNVSDILACLNLYMIPQHTEARVVLPANAEENTLLALINHEAQHIDELIRTSGLSVSVVTATLTIMELKGMIKQVGGMQYIRSTLI